MKKEIYSIVITANQYFWNYRTDYLGTASSLEKAKEMIKEWIIKNEYLKHGEKFDEELNSSVEIWKQNMDEIFNPDREIISVDLNKLLE